MEIIVSCVYQTLTVSHARRRRDHCVQWTRVASSIFAGLALPPGPHHASLMVALNGVRLVSGSGRTGFAASDPFGRFRTLLPFQIWASDRDQSGVVVSRSAAAGLESMPKPAEPEPISLM
jgi:hypothetical protein